MIETIITGWWKVLAIFGGAVISIGALVALSIVLVKTLRKEGVDEVQAGPVKIDFEDDPAARGKE